MADPCSGTCSNTALSNCDMVGYSAGIRHMIRTPTEYVDFVSIANSVLLPKVLLEERLNFCTFTSVQYITSINIIDSINIQDIVSIVWSSIIDESLIYDDTFALDPNILSVIIEKLIINDITDNKINAQLIIIDTLNYLDAIIEAWGIEVTEVLNITESVSLQLTYLSQLLESINFIDDNTFVLHMFTMLNDSVLIADDSDINQILNQRLEDGIYFSGGLIFGGKDDSYTFVINTMSKGITTYQNFNFNSLYGDMAASDDGIYQLVGDDDDGNIIESSFKTALMDFGSSLHKQVPYAYIGFSSSGELVLKAISNQDGVKKERWYQCKPSRDADAVSRVQLGRGVKAKYWQFELANVDGADFDIESIELMPLSLKRRI